MMQSEFAERAGRILPHGLGLSVDVYQPDLLELMRMLQNCALQPDFLEVFKASTSALGRIRTQFPDLPLAYHGEGLWVTQPEFRDSASGRAGVQEASEHLSVLRSAWLNHECATKQLGGYSFGTYLPPLYTELVARLTADNLRHVQSRLDERADVEGVTPPLVLLEMPPLTYFVCGTMPVPGFFRVVTDRVACGLVLDLGHLWTVYRYTGAWREQSVEAFARLFLKDFPLERVVEIHVAGLAAHCEDRLPLRDGEPPRWIDSHAAAIPELLFELLHIVLQDPRLTSLKGIALEVDTKPLADIVSEFSRFRTEFASERQRRFSPSAGRPPRDQFPLTDVQRHTQDGVSQEEQMVLGRLYRSYAEFVVRGEPGVSVASIGVLHGDKESLSLYREMYLPYEILHWGGEVDDMFPMTCAALREAGIELKDFVAFWHGNRTGVSDPYDFFLLKIDRFVDFVSLRAAAIAATARREAGELRRAYAAANEAVTVEGASA